MTLLGGGGMCGGWHIQIPYTSSLFKISFSTPIKGEHGPLYILAIAVTVVQPGFVYGGQSEGAKKQGVGGGF